MKFAKYATSGCELLPVSLPDFWLSFNGLKM